MGKKNLGKLPAEIVDQYGSEADQMGLTRAEYVRKCIETGRLVFQTSGEMNIERLRELSERERAASFNSDLKTAEGDLTEAILTNLPTEDHRALTKEEIRTAVFGTEEEQRDQITDALKQLNQKNKIQPLVDDGYIKTIDNE
jgi:hypothetical protein